MSNVVAKLWIESQTSLGGTLTFRTIQGGDFRLNGVLSVNTSANAGNIHIVAVWTDLYRSEGVVSPNLAYNSSSAISFSQIVHAVPNTDVYIQMNGDAVPVGSNFSFYATIEELSAPSLQRP